MGITNQLLAMSTRGQPEPYVGMPATILHFSDREACTIVEVFKLGRDTAVTVQADHWKRIDTNGMSESQDYEYERNLNGNKNTFKFNVKKGRWVEVLKNLETMRWSRVGTNSLRIGVREKYYDFTF